MNRRNALWQITRRSSAAALLTGCAFSAVAAGTVVIEGPMNIDFGTVRVGDFAEESLTITNNSDVPVLLGALKKFQGFDVCLATSCMHAPMPDDITVPPAHDGCGGVILQPGQRCHSTIRFEPKHPGHLSAFFEVAVYGRAAPLSQSFSAVGRLLPLECVLDWGERNIPGLQPRGRRTWHATPFHARCYGSWPQQTCVGADTAATEPLAAHSIYVLEQQPGGIPQRVADLAELAAIADDPVTGLSCAQAALQR